MKKPNFKEKENKLQLRMAQQPMEEHKKLKASNKKKLKMRVLLLLKKKRRMRKDKLLEPHNRTLKNT